MSTCDGSPVSRELVSGPTVRRDPVLTAVTVIVGVIVGLTFLFGFGNVLSLAIRLRVPGWVAPLVAPAVDLSVVGLLVAIRHLATRGAEPAVLRPARRLLLGSSVVTLALNVAEPLVSGDVGRALFDGVGPLLLIGWAEVGPGLLRALAVASGEGAFAEQMATERASSVRSDDHGDEADALATVREAADGSADLQQPTATEDLLAWAREEDIRHREVHQRPISAENLRKRLHIGSARSRELCSLLRSEPG